MVGSGKEWVKERDDLHICVQLPSKDSVLRSFLFILACSLLTVVLVHRDLVYEVTIGLKANVERPNGPSTIKAVPLPTTDPVFALPPSNGTTEFIIDTSRLDRTQGFTYIANLVKIGGIDFRKVASYPLKDEWLTPMDREILADPPVQDLSAVAEERHSVIRLVPGPLVDAGNIRVGTNITVRVDLKDAKGRPVQKGGHRVRVWMVQKGRKRSMATDVTDMRNGSFLATFPVLWSGKTEVRAAVPRPREFQRMLLTLMSKMKLMNQNVAVYSLNPNTEQVVLCSFVPVIAGFPEVCNLTDLNSGLPWYCGKPSKKGLQCNHWAWSGHTHFPEKYPMSDTENALMKKFTTDVRGLHQLPHSLFFNAGNGTYGGSVPKTSVNQTCVPLTPRASWTDQSPRGFWENGIWHPLNDCPLLPVNQSCYKDTHLHFMGDSNAVQMYQLLQPLLGCGELPDPKRSYHPNMLHVPLRCTSPRWNLTICWIPHAYPFFSGEGQWSDTRVKQSPAAVMREVPSTGKHVVFFHLFVHYGQTHSAIFALHVRDTARGVRDLLARNPNVKVFVRGPHSVTGNRFQMTGDYHVDRNFAILRHEFRDLRDHVMLLNDWDMTVALENYNIHPIREVQQTLAKMMTAHICS